MKKIVDDMRLMIKVCDLYYNEGLGQQQIADLLNIRSKRKIRSENTADP